MRIETAEVAVPYSACPGHWVPTTAAICGWQWLSVKDIGLGKLTHLRVS